MFEAHFQTFEDPEAGVALTARRWREISLLWFVQVSMTLTYVIFHPSTRYRAPSDPLLFLFSAYTLVWVWNRIRGPCFTSTFHLV